MKEWVGEKITNTNRDIGMPRINRGTTNKMREVVKGKGKRRPRENRTCCQATSEET